jgi:hypothetical protein
MLPLGAHPRGLPFLCLIVGSSFVSMVPNPPCYEFIEAEELCSILELARSPCAFDDEGNLNLYRDSPRVSRRSSQYPVEILSITAVPWNPMSSSVLYPGGDGVVTSTVSMVG